VRTHNDNGLPTKPHKIQVYASLEGAAWGYSDGKWVIRVKGVTSGAVIHGGDGDNMEIEFKLDASRFHPVISNERTT